MPKYLIVNADDFGYSYGVNKGIIEAHTKGIVTSTSVMVDAMAAHEAKELSAFPELSVGLHFAVKEIANVEAEFARQVEKFTRILGRAPDHIDSHKRHTTAEGLREVIEVYAREHQVPVRRFGHAKFIGAFFGMAHGGGTSVDPLKNAIGQATDEYNELMCHVGYSDDYLREHSSYNDLREAELKSICDPEIKEYIKAKDLVLIGWRDVLVTAI